MCSPLDIFHAHPQNQLHLTDFEEEMSFCWVHNSQLTFQTSLMRRPRQKRSGCLLPKKAYNAVTLAGPRSIARLSRFLIKQSSEWGSSYHVFLINWQTLPNHEFDKVEVTYLLPKTFSSWLPFSEMPYFLALNISRWHVFLVKDYISLRNCRCKAGREAHIMIKESHSLKRCSHK